VVGRITVANQHGHVLAHAFRAEGCRAKGAGSAFATSRTPHRQADLEQDFATIAPYTIEEAYEVADAIARGDMAALEALCREKRIDEVVFAYSDVPHALVMHLASEALAAGADLVQGYASGMPEALPCPGRLP